MRQAPAIGFACRVSPTLVVATIVVTLLALMAVWISGLPFSLRVGLPTFVAAVGGVSLGRLVRPRIRSVRWRSDGGVDLVLNDRWTRGHQEVQGAIRDARVMGPLIALTLGWPPRNRTTLWLLPDNLDADTRRRLRMRIGADASGLASGNADSG